MSTRFLLASLVLSSLTITAQAAPVQVKVTVENLSPVNSVAIAPLRLGFHSGTFDAFNIGQTAGAEIIAIAEGGSDALWNPAFQAADPTAVVGSVLPAGIIHGETSSATFMVDPSVNRYFSFAAMVVPSNDFFIGNDDPTEYELFDATGNLKLTSITQKSRDIWDAGSEVHDPLAAAFISGATNGNRANQNSVVAFNFAEFSAYNGLTTARGYTFDSQLTADSDVYKISFEVTPVPEPETYALLLAGLGLVGLLARRRNLKTMRIG